MNKTPLRYFSRIAYTFLISAICFLLSDSTSHAYIYDYFSEINNLTGYKAMISDDTDLLTDEECEQLIEVMYRFTLHYNIAIITRNEYSFHVIQNNDELYSHYFEEKNGVLILLDSSNKEIFIDTGGEASEIITDSDIQAIIKKISPLFSSEDYSECCNKAVEQFADLLKIDEKNSATNYQAGVIDNAGLFSEEESLQLLKQMQPILQYCNVAVVTSNLAYDSAEICANKYYSSLFQERNGTIFLIDMYNREVYICSDGETDQIINKSNALSITDNVYRLATKGKYYECSSKALDQMLRVIKGKKIARPMKYICNLLLALTIALSISFAWMARYARRNRLKFKEIVAQHPQSIKITEPEFIITHHTWEDPSSTGGGGIVGARGGRVGGGRVGGRSGGGRVGGGRVGGGHRF